MMLRKLLFLQISFLAFFYSYAASIKLLTKDAVVWLPQQTIKGKIIDASVAKVKWHLNNANGFAKVQRNGAFDFSITLYKTNNIIWVEDASQLNITSDTINYTLGYKPLPEVMPYATIKNNVATLNLKVINNSYNLPLQFIWKAVDCPAHVLLQNANKQKANAVIPPVNGKYYFAVTVVAGKDSAVYKTYVTRVTNKLYAFNITKHAMWIDSAIIYEITPYVFVKNGMYNDITAKLAEIKELGVNTIWLQPVYKTYSGEQGYDVTDYFSLRPDLGTEGQLQHLIATAKNLNMHVLFDFVPNHTSIHHPYAEEVKQYQQLSHYYNFYQHTNDDALYSFDYVFDSLGFVHYFWKSLVNLNYNNPEVQRWIIEAFKYWLQKFDLDGYRIDAAWAVNARNPSFGKQLQSVLKSIKPDILILAEDKGARKSVYDEGYDAAYDWTKDTGWISSWSWATDYNPPKNPTIFNYYNESKRSVLLNKSLFKNGDTTHFRLRFLENNDQQRFITAHSLERTKMASALTFALPGLPMLYNGQEIGFERKPYSNKYIFKPNQSIQSLDTNNLFPWYEKLCKLRIQHEALRSNNMETLPVNVQTMYALHRWQNNEHIIIVSNLSEEDTTVTINIQSIRKPTASTVKYIDLITKENFYTNANAFSLTINMKKYSTRLLLVSW